MVFSHWFSGDIETAEPVTLETNAIIAERMESQGSLDYQFHVEPYPYGIKKNMLIVNFYYNSGFDLKKVASIFEEEFGATSGLWLLVGKWVKKRPVKDIICACDCTGLDWFLCDDCLKTFPPVYPADKITTCYVNGVKCCVSKGRYGEGIEITRQTDRIPRYQDEIKNMKKRHALEEEDDLRRINERRAQRRKEMESLEEEMGRIFL